MGWSKADEMAGEQAGEQVGEQASDMAGEAPLACAACGRALDGDPDEDPTGDAGLPICGECARERDFFVMDVADGDLDGQIG
jgi:hypothetical protein